MLQRRRIAAIVRNVSGLLAVPAFVTGLAAATITVNPGDTLQTKIDGAVGGDTVVINAAAGGTTYGRISLTNRTFTSSAPLIIKKGTGGKAIIGGSDLGANASIKMQGCSYIVFDGVDGSLVLTGNLQGVFLRSSNHVIFRNLTIETVGQEGMKLFDNSTYIDVLGCHIHATGASNSSFGEGIYVGTGNYGSWGNTYPDRTDLVWIENNKIHNTAYGEAINVKGEEVGVTIRGNEVYNITPGSTTQWNGGAINVEYPSNTTLSGGAGYGDGVAAAGVDRPTTVRTVWIENNNIHDIANGTNSQGLGNGIMTFCYGARIKNNTITGTQQNGISVNDYAEPLWSPYIYNNTITGYGTGYNAINKGGNASYLTSDPGTNPYSSQTWYNPTPTVVTDAFGSSNANWTKTAGGTFTVTAGQLELTAPAGFPANNAMGNVYVHNTTYSGNFEVSAKCRVTDNGSSTFEDFSVVFNYTDLNNYYFANFAASNDAYCNGIFKVSGGVLTQLADFTTMITPGTWYNITVRRVGSELTVLRNGSIVGDITVSGMPSSATKFGLGSKNDVCSFDDFVVDAIGSMSTSTIEAEDTSVTLTNGVVLATLNAGSVGSYADYPATGGTVEWVVWAPSTGSYNVSFRYANGDAAARSGSLAINAGSGASQSFSSTGAWTTWSNKSVAVTLLEGPNTVRLSGPSASSMANVDSMTASP